MNRVLLSAKVLERSATRYTPAGVPALDLVLGHEGQIQQEGQVRRVSFELKAVAFGAVQAHIAGLALGSEACFEGFLAPGRNGRGLLFNVVGAEPVEPAGP